MFAQLVAPRQQRSRQSLRRIVGAVENLLHEGGFREATVAEICRRAGCSVGSFYARFGGKEAAFHYFHEQMCRRATAFGRQMLEPGGWEGASVEEILRRYLRLLVRNYIKNRGLLRAGLLFGQQTGSEEFNRRARQAERETLDAMTRLFERHRKEISLSPRIAATTFQRIVRGVLMADVLFGDPPASDADLLAGELSKIVFAALDLAGKPSPEKQ